MWNQLTIGYLAGIIDGEGSVTFQRNGRKTPNARVSVSMTDQDSINRIFELSGIGYVGGPYTRNGNNPNRKPYWTWQLYKASDIARLLCAIAPLLSERKQLKCLEAACSIQLRSKPKECGKCNKSYQGQPNQLYCSTRCNNKASNDRRRATE